MEVGACPRCAQPYTVAEVTGLGILRSRPAAEGGPRVEYRCGACNHLIRLVPHGHGRYAPPGEAPPPPPPETARRPSWVGAPRDDDEPVEVDVPPAARGARDPVGVAASAPVELVDDDPPSPAEALELLGCGPTATPEDLDRAFRERSLTCHPDKVAHLDPEFQTLAQRKFLRLRLAYELLRSTAR